MLTSIIIVNYNTGKILQQCVESIYKFEKENNFEIVIVDNNSNDDSQSYIKNIQEDYKNVKTIYQTNKTGFSAANNTGYNSSSGSFILIMNPDIIFTEPVLNKLTEDLNKNKTLGAVSPLLIGKDGGFQRNYFQRYPTIMQFILFYSILGNVFKNNKKLINKYQENLDININSNTIEFTQQIPCAFFFTERNVFEKAGRMDESYYLFFEDVDLSYLINKHHKIGVDTSVKVTHLGGSSFKTSDDYWLYGRFILGMLNFSRKNYGSVNTFFLKILAVLNSYLIILIENIKKISGKGNDYRLRKHKFFITEYKKTYS